MRTLISSVFPFLGAALLISGCAGPEQKLGRGMNNLTEFARMGDLRRSYEQTSVLESPAVGYTTGVIRGLDLTLARTATGFYEVATFPFPNRSPKDYGPIFTNTFPENPVNPDSYTPGWLSDQMTSPDNSLGFGGGDIMPFVPGSRFHIFDQ